MGRGKQEEKLRQLQSELLAVEAPEEEDWEEYEEEEDLEEYRDFPEEEAPRHRDLKTYSRKTGVKEFSWYGEEEEPEDAWTAADHKAARRAAKKRRRKNRFLGLVAVLEILVIGFILMKVTQWLK